MQPNHFVRRLGYQWIAILLAALVVQTMELGLLQAKYSLFTGGFLQPYSFRTLSDRVLLAILLFWLNILLLGIVGGIWFRMADRLRIHPWLAAYNYLYLVIAGFGFWLAVKFKVLTYFSDTLDFVVARNLAGGSLGRAFRYVADEGALFLVGLGLALVFYVLGLFVLRRKLKKGGLPKWKSSNVRLRYLLPFLLLVTVGLLYWIARAPKWHYGLGKTTSYALLTRLIDPLSDFDRDGFGLLRFPPDPNDGNSTVYPGALDIPNNGVDEDGYVGDFSWRGEEPDRLARIPPQPGAHILLVVLESTRADMVGKRWHGRLVAPHFTRMAEEGSHVPYAYSHTGYTVSSLLALFNRSLSERGEKIRLLDYLEKAGYQISIISGQDESFGNMASLTGMNAPGHYFLDARTAIEDRVFPSKDPGSLRLSEARLVKAFRERVAQTDWSRPNFFYVNLQAAHFPYSHPHMPMLLIDRPVPRSELTPENAEKVQSAYWNAIAVADDAFGQMTEILKKKGTYENTLVVVLGDHGESLFDDGHLGHGFELSEIQTRIPLIFNRKGVNIGQAVGQLDIAELIVTLATGRFDPNRWQNRDRAVFQFVGGLDRPRLIDTVKYGEVRTLLDLVTRKVFFSDLKQWKTIEDSLQDESTASRTRELVDNWESARWRKHLFQDKREPRRTSSAD